MGLKEDMQPAAWGVSIPFIVLTGVTCLLRFYSRLYISKSFGPDDWFMVAASVGIVSFSSLSAIKSDHEISSL